MKKLNNLLTVLIISGTSLTLAACNSGSANNGATQQATNSSGGNNAASNNVLPQVSTDDLKAIFTASKAPKKAGGKNLSNVRALPIVRINCTIDL